VAEELLAIKAIFLSRVVYQTFNGYVLSQFKKMQADIRKPGNGEMEAREHLIRLLISGIIVLKHGSSRCALTSTANSSSPSNAAKCRGKRPRNGGLSLHAEFDRTFAETKLPERPDYEKANAFLIKARYHAVEN